MTRKKDRLITREQLDCYRRDISSSHPVFSFEAIQSLKECIESDGNFDCEATRLNAISLYCSLSPHQ
jgi:hypothetical protein